MLNSDFNRFSAASSLEEGRNKRCIRVYDCRFEDKKAAEKSLEISGLDFNDFRQVLHREFAIHSHEIFVLATTDRTVVDFDKFEKLQNGSTLYLLQSENQALPVATEEQINFTPHYDTLIECGTYEYSASEGQNPLAFTFAELIDNSLSATAKNTETRTIEIRMIFDETLGKPAVIVLDNGRGMTCKQLNNWAVYRLSKFTRDNNIFASEEDKYVRPDPVPRSLNSDISHFGVGGKHAVFYIGASVRMISKPVGSPDVHELTLSKEEFERKVKNKEDVFTSTITNRKPGDFSHVNKVDEHFLRQLITEELGKESFTAVVITGVKPEHIISLKKDGGFTGFTRQLAHVYHYYLHGVNGNDIRINSTNSHHPKIDIQVTLREKPPRCPRVINLREVEDDMQTLYITAAADTFEFKACTEPHGGTVEGILRYHPFLYHRETYPKDPSCAEASGDNDDDCNNESEDKTREKIFECFWNGRLIPHTKIKNFDWCTRPKSGSLPPECYSRFSGVLFTDDRFKVTTNKLTFIDLELKLKDKQTIFTCVVNGQKSKRSNIQQEFTKWLKTCHENLDKQVKFLGFKKTITRTDVNVKKMQHPWAAFSSIERDCKIYKAGQLVKTVKTQPNHYGSVIQFLLYGDHKTDVFAPGGFVEIALEPRALYDQTKIVPISKIDRSATDDTIRQHIDSDSTRLPDKLSVDWPDGNPWSQNDVQPAGTPFGAIKIQILNKKEEPISRMPTLSQATQIRLSVKLIVLHHVGPKRDEVVVSYIAQHSAKWGFWFRKIENLTNPGKYTLFLNAIISETNQTVFGGRDLPSYKLSFSIKEGSANGFDVGTMSSTLRVGVPFDIPLQIKDPYGHLTVPPPNVQPVLQCSDLDVSYDTVDSSGTTFIIKNVKARGTLNYHQSKTYDLKVTLPGLKKDTQTIKISLLPGKPHSLHVMPDDSLITVENGNPVTFKVEIHDEAGNITAQPKQIVRCQVHGFPPVATDCSTGAGQLVTKPINLKIINGEPQKLKVQFDIPSQKNITLVKRELNVMPSTRVAVMELYSQDNEHLVLRNHERIEWLAGGLLENLFYKLYDEAGKEVPLTAEIASMIMVTWTRDVDLEDLGQGKLPDIQVPTQVQEERYHLVSYQDQSVSVSFTLVPRPDEPAGLKVTMPQGTVKLGETLSENINLELVDQYENATKTLTSTCVSDISVEAEGLDKSAITFIWQESSNSVEVAGVCFQFGAPGPREMCFTYGTYVERVIIKVTAGDPAKLKLVSGPDQILNDHSIPTPFLVQLFDEWGYPSTDQRVVVELKSSPPALKITTAVVSQPVDAEGKASFTVTSVSGPKGYYQLVFRCSFNNKPIPGPSVNLIVLPDPNKPVGLSVDYDNSAKCPAGGTFPVFSVTVVSDEGGPITTFNPAAVSMWLWEGVSTGETPPETATELKCSKPMENDRKDCFHFRDKEIPERAGKHTIQFSLRNTKPLYSKQIIINVVANQPFKLGPDSKPPATVVSYSKAIANRILVENMTLRIMDSYGNPAGQDLDGMVVVSIQSSSGHSNSILPLFEDRKNRQHIRLVDGKAHITRLAIMENSPGDDGSAYTLIFKPEVSVVPMPLAPFELTFHFFNNLESQKKIQHLSMKKQELTNNISVLQEYIADYTKYLKMLTERQMSASRKVTDIRNVLIQRKLEIPQTVSITDIDRLIAQKTTDADRILKMPRRVFSVRDHFKGQQDVLGMVGHLALVEDDAAAWVISWSIRSDMNCVVTRTLEAAERIIRDTQDRQEVMALESMWVPQGNRPLPHIRNGHMLFNPPGNPVYARDLLIYPNSQESCKTNELDLVFKNVLGNTIVIDDRASGNSYRKALVQKQIPCPTILTRQGEMITAKGKFGGSQNKAPPMNTLKVFGAPLPRQYQALRNEIDMLIQYQSALKKSEEVGKEREDHLKEMKSSKMLEKQQALEEKKKQLERIEMELGSTPGSEKHSLGKRVFQDAGEPSGIITKRAKQRST